MITGQGLKMGGTGVGGYFVGCTGLVPPNTPIHISCANYNATGTTRYERGADFTDQVDTKFITYVGYAEMIATDGNEMLLTAAASRVDIYQAVNETLRYRARASNGTVLSQITTTGTLTADGKGHPIMYSADVGTNGAHYAYLDMVEDKTVSTHTDGTISHTNGNWALGAFTDGTIHYDGLLGVQYLNTDEVIVFDVESNRRKFFDNDGWPVWIGWHGELPTGNQPVLFTISGRGDDNWGYGGDMPVVEDDPMNFGYIER